MIGLQGIEKVYRTERIETVALTNVNLEVREGEFISIMGPSGCGKSTLRRSRTCGSIAARSSRRS